MKRMTQKSLRNFAESLTDAIEEVADKIGTIESILNGGDEEVDGEDDYTAEEPVVEEPAVEDTTAPEAEEPVTDEAPAEEPAVAPETETEQFSENRYQSVKDFLSRNVNF